MFTFLSIVYVLVCLFLIAVVLLQSGKGGGMGSAFGGASSQTVFGGAGAGNFLTRATAVFAALFMLLSMVLAYLSSDRAAEAALKQAQAPTEPAKKTNDDAAPSEPEPPAAGMSTGQANEGVAVEANIEGAGEPATEEPAGEAPGAETAAAPAKTAPAKAAPAKTAPAETVPAKAPAKAPADPAPTPAPADPAGGVEE